MKISSVQTVWKQNVANAKKKAPKLTEAELDIAIRFMAGEQLAEMAEAKGRSINTLRTQAKTLLNKTKLKTQSELVRLFSALQNIETAKSDGSIERDYKKQTANLVNLSASKIKLLKRPYGRNLYYEIFGDPDGQPVLFIHGVLAGTKLPQNVIDYLYARKIKLITPHRAGFGKSSPLLDQYPDDHFIADILALLEQEKIDKLKSLVNLLGRIGRH